MSLTRKALYPPADSLLDIAVTALIDADIPVIVAAGNSRSDARHYSPARVPEVITVGALDGKKIAATSNSGNMVDIYTQGENILSAAIGDTCGQVVKSGTSMAAARVAGRAVLMMANGIVPKSLATALQGEATRVETGNFTGETSRFVLDTGGAGDLNNPLCPDATKPLAAPEH